MKNQRGEVATAVVIAIAAGSLLLGLILPKFNPLSGLFGRSQSAANQHASFTKQSAISTPILLSSRGGEPVAVGTKFEQVYETGLDQSVPRPTIGQRIGSFFFGLTTWGLVFVVVCLAFFGGAPLIWLGKKYFVMKHALKNTVAGIREADAETYQKLKPALAANHDRKDKVVIDKLKAELHK